MAEVAISATHAGSWAAGGVALSRASAQASGVPLPHPTPSCSAMALAKLSSKATVV